MKVSAVISIVGAGFLVRSGMSVSLVGNVEGAGAGEGRHPRNPMLGVGIIRRDSCVVNHSCWTLPLDVVRHSGHSHLPTQSVTRENAIRSGVGALLLYPFAGFNTNHRSILASLLGFGGRAWPLRTRQTCCGDPKLAL